MSPLGDSSSSSSNTARRKFRESGLKSARVAVTMADASSPPDRRVGPGPVRQDVGDGERQADCSQGVTSASFLLNVHFCNSRFPNFSCIVAAVQRGTNMTMLQDHIGELAYRDELNSAAPLLLAPGERRAPTAILSSAKLAALTACLNSGMLYKRSGVWTAPSARTSDKPISGVTVADLGRDGMLTLTMLRGGASARLTTRGSWFARTAMTEMAERAAP